MKRKIKRVLAVMTAVVSLTVGMSSFAVSASYVDPASIVEEEENYIDYNFTYYAREGNTEAFGTFRTTSTTTTVAIYFIQAEVGPATITLHAATGAQIGDEIIIPTNPIATQRRSFSVSPNTDYALDVKAPSNGPAYGSVTVRVYY